MLCFIASRRACHYLTSGKTLGVTVRPTKTGDQVMEPRLVQLVMHTEAHAVTSLLTPQIKAPCPLRGHRYSLTSGHSVVNVLFCSCDPKTFCFLRDAGSSLRRKKYYHFSLIFLHSRANRASQTSRVLLAIAKGKAAGNRAQKRVPRSLDSDSRDGTAHACPVWVHLEQVRRHMEPDCHNPKKPPTQVSYPPTVQMMGGKDSSRII